VKGIGASQGAVLEEGYEGRRKGQVTIGGPVQMMAGSGQFIRSSPARTNLCIGAMDFDAEVEKTIVVCIRDFQ